MIKSQDELTEQGRQSEVLIKAIEKCEKLEQENAQLRKWCEEFNALDVAKENEKLKLIIKRTKASGNYASRVSAYKARIINLSEENQQLKKQKDISDKNAETWFKVSDEKSKEADKLKELLYSLKCCLTSQNIEPQIRIEKALAKIDGVLK